MHPVRRVICATFHAPAGLDTFTFIIRHFGLPSIVEPHPNLSSTPLPLFNNATAFARIPEQMEPDSSHPGNFMHRDSAIGPRSETLQRKQGRRRRASKIPWSWSVGLCMNPPPPLFHKRHGECWLEDWSRSGFCCSTPALYVLFCTWLWLGW